jgi:hypothetical protein
MGHRGHNQIKILEINTYKGNFQRIFEPLDAPSTRSVELFYEPGELTAHPGDKRRGFEFRPIGRRSSAALRGGSGSVGEVQQKLLRRKVMVCG